MSWKEDGLTIVLRYKNGVFDKAITNVDGEIFYAKDFGFEDYTFRLSLRDKANKEKYIVKLKITARIKRIYIILLMLIIIHIVFLESNYFLILKLSFLIIQVQ